MKRKDLSEKKWAVLEDLFYSDLDEIAVLKKHNVTRTTYERWLRQKLFSRQFQQYTASLARRLVSAKQSEDGTALVVAKAETEVAVRLVQLTRCQKEESARKACQNVLAISNRFFEAVARINEGPLEGKSKRIYPQGSGDPYGGASWNPQTGERGNFGGKRGENGGNRGVFGENRGSFGECRDIFGLNQGACSTIHDDPAHNHTRPEITPEQASKILAILAEDVDENEPRVVQVDDPTSPPLCRAGSS